MASLVQLQLWCASTHANRGSVTDQHGTGPKQMNESNEGAAHRHEVVTAAVFLYVGGEGRVVAREYREREQFALGCRVAHKHAVVCRHVHDLAASTGMRTRAELIECKAFAAAMLAAFWSSCRWLLTAAAGLLMNGTMCACAAIKSNGEAMPASTACEKLPHLHHERVQQA